jgi:hypothetical protein
MQIIIMRLVNFAGGYSYDGFDHDLTSTPEPVAEMFHCFQPASQVFWEKGRT